jgi:CBS domain-containing protein
MSLERFCRKHLVKAEPTDSALHIARLMRDHHVGAVVIVDSGDVPIGMVTDRDLALRVIADVRDGTAPAEAFMSRDPVTIRCDARLDDVIALIHQERVRRLPIVDQSGALVGLVALDDLSVLLAGELHASVEAVQHDRGP